MPGSTRARRTQVVHVVCLVGVRRHCRAMGDGCPDEAHEFRGRSRSRGPAGGCRGPRDADSGGRAVAVRATSAPSIPAAAPDGERPAALPPCADGGSCQAASTSARRAWMALRCSASPEIIRSGPNPRRPPARWGPGSAGSRRYRPQGSLPRVRRCRGSSEASRLVGHSVDVLHQLGLAGKRLLEREPRCLERALATDHAHGVRET